ncbi:MAG: hypothetical protein K5694_05590 [Bacilli bacterium]|nr:hypothetical protein [Bacilli bacterium]
MKSFKKICVLALLALPVISACGNQGGSASGSSGQAQSSSAEASSFELNKETVLMPGYTSLENANANVPLDGKGTYTYGDLKFQAVDTYRTVYSKEPTDAKFNYLINKWTYNSEHYTNLVDGLIENDKYGNLVGALAFGYKNENGTDWYFQLREGLAWVNNKTGEIYAEVTAQDFVDGLKYVLDPINGSATAGIVTDQIAGAEEYYNAMSELDGAGADFSKVGISAESKYVVKYTTAKAMPYFMSCLTYSPYLPISAAYLEEEGTDFGSTEDHILVNGAFRITNHVRNNVMVYTKNDKYWDAKHVYVETVEKKYYDSSIENETTTRKWFEAGYIDGFTVTNADTDGWNKYVNGLDEEGEPLVEGAGSVDKPYSPICNGVMSYGDATYIGYFNYDRQHFDSNSDKTAGSKAATKAAVANANFRKGFLYGYNALEYLKRMNGKEPWQKLMRAYTNRNLCSYEGQDYADLVDEVFNEKQGLTGEDKVSLTGINQKGDPIFDIEKAEGFFAAAKEELLEAGLTEGDFPIEIDVIGSQVPKLLAYEQASYAALNTLSDYITINLNVPSNDDEDTLWGSVNQDYDFSIWSGWGPDYADPQTFLATCAIGGDITDGFGFGLGTEENEAIEAAVLGDYTAAFQEGAAITDATRIGERYQKFAEAEYKLIYEDAIIVPWYSANGYSAVVAKTVAHQAGTSTYGLTSDKLKNVVVTSEAITKEVRAQIDAIYEAGKGA